MTKLNRGFTLVELLIVIAVIGILAGIGVSTYPAFIKKGRDAQRKTDLQQIRSALEMYRADKDSYPLSNGSYQILGCEAACTTACSWGGGAWTCGSPSSTYMQKLPNDPQGINYRYSSDGSTYNLEACLENANDPDLQAGAPSYGACTSGKAYKVTNP